MRYLSLDIETTDLDPATGQVLQIAVVADDLGDQKPLSELLRWECLIKHEKVTGEHYAIAMNIEIIEALKRLPDDYTWPKRASLRGREVQVFHSTEAAIHYMVSSDAWDYATQSRKGPLLNRRTAMLAGKNLAGFDLKWLDPYGLAGTYKHRVLDLGNLMAGRFPHEFMLGEGGGIPSMRDLFDRVPHDAMGDALAVVRGIREVVGSSTSVYGSPGKLPVDDLLL